MNLKVRRIINWIGFILVIIAFTILLWAAMTNNLGTPYYHSDFLNGYGLAISLAFLSVLCRLLVMEDRLEMKIKELEKKS